MSDFWVKKIAFYLFRTLKWTLRGPLNGEFTFGKFAVCNLVSPVAHSANLNPKNIYDVFGILVGNTMQ